MRRRGPMSHGEIVVKSQFAAGMTQEGLGEHLGASRRTVTRWVVGQSSPSDEQLVEMVRLAHARNPEVGAQLAAGLGETLESLGIVVAPPPQVASAPTPVPVPVPAPRTAAPALVLEGILHAAAHAMDLSPRAVRIGLQAAFKRARELGATVEEVEKALAIEPAEPSP